MAFGTAPVSTGCGMITINIGIKNVTLHPEHFNKKLVWVVRKEGIKHWGSGECESLHPD